MALLADNTEMLVNISMPTLFVSVLPLLGLAVVSHHMGLHLESPMVVGVIRAFIQLSILGAILTPIFDWGTQQWWIVVAYAAFMVTFASHEASSRSKYYFKGLFVSILFSFFVNIGLVSLFSFGIVIQPTPVWNPQYVIPIVGMLLGNCINGVALAVNSLLNSYVEQATEIEIYLAFGASPREASARLTQEAVRIGAMPMINSMSVIGLISIPGMMTGQILGGSPVQEAARYQMLIMYLIATVTFGTILVQSWMVRHVAFTRDCLDTNNFIKRPARVSILAQCRGVLHRIFATTRQTSDSCQNSLLEEQSAMISDSTNGYESVSSSWRGNPDIVPISKGATQNISSNTTSITLEPHLELKSLSRSFISGNPGIRRILFQDLSARLQSGDIVAVRGPSGIGKTQLLRLVAGLVPLYDDSDGKVLGQVLLQGQAMASFHNLSHWRRQVRYVSQYKVDIPGTPTDFMDRITRLAAWQKAPPKTLWSMTTSLIREWGMDVCALDVEWKKLSGGEAQRVYLAIAVASQPAVLLMDESTAALDVNSKKKVEESIGRIAAEQGMVVLWITHDQDQVDRMGSRSV